MQRQNTDCVLVIDGSELVGIITAFDILHKVAGTNEDLNAITCAHVMTQDPVCLREDDDMAVALHKMATGEFRHIPLVENGVPVRVVSVADVFHHLSPHLT
jgi:CBS domain-containing protein